MENYEASKSNVWDFCFKISPRSVKVDKGKRGHLYKQISKNTFWNFLIYLLTILSLPLVPIHNTFIMVKDKLPNMLALLNQTSYQTSAIC